MIMVRTTILLSSFLLMCNVLLAAPPEAVLPLSKEIRSLTYYQEQARLWEAEVQLNPQQAMAWLHYYTAARNATILSGTMTYDLGGIVLAAKEVLPTTFETYYLTYWQSSVFDRRYDALLAAHELAPEREEIAFDMLHYYEVSGAETAGRAHCNWLFEQGLLAAGILDWNYNALASIREGGLLLTQAENDTYPAWVLQQVKGIRPDVRVLNVYDLLSNAAYRQRIFVELEIPDFQRNVRGTVDEQLQGLLLHISEHSERTLHLGIATPARQRSSLDGELYLTGLAFEHSSLYLDNMALLQHNFETLFLTEQLEFNLHYEAQQRIVDHMNINYLPALALLHELYQEKGETQAAERVQNMALNIAERSGRLSEVSPFFAEPLQPAPATTELDLRAIDKALQAVGEDSYASAYEVSRAEYAAFLADLAAAGQDEQLAICRIHPTDWRSLLPEVYQGLPEEVLFDEGSPESSVAPIVNISQAAAEAYCAWLTLVYNSSDHRRKRFEKVRFYLPSAEEWKRAARGNSADAPYPWSGAYNRNAKGCYLNNFNPYLVSLSSEEAVFGPGEKAESPGDDGAYFPARVDAYLPNDLGLYNMSGNVAEMVSTPGITCGGGWQDPAYYTQIGVEKTVETPSANVGFRIFMKVVK